jgi:RNA polymerase sigma-70 factor (ECF subfamily)
VIAAATVVTIGLAAANKGRRHVTGRDPDWTALMQAARGGDRAAYERLLRDVARAMRPAVRNALMRACGQAADMEDVVQDILIAVHLKQHTWDEGRPFGPWLSAIARYKVIDALRRRGRRAEIPIDDFTDTLAAAPEPESATERDVTRSLEALPLRQRDVVRTIAVEGASIAQAAARLRMSEGAVRVALHRGLASLAKAAGQVP